MKKFSITLLSAFMLLTAGLASAAPAVDINSASAEVLAERLSGVGLVKATAIVKYRETHGPFGSPSQLQEVAGIGPKIVETNADRILIRLPDKKASERGAAGR